VEFLTEIHGVSSLLVASVGIPLAGMILLFISTVLSKKITVFKSWKSLLMASIFLAAAVFLWYDSVTRVGASKEGLLAGPLETIVVLILAWLLLKERLRKIQLVGVIIALLGFFATVSSRSLDLRILFTHDKFDGNSTSGLPVEDFLFSASGGFLLGALAGYAIKKVMKISAVVIGLFVAVLAYLDIKLLYFHLDIIKSLQALLYE
jgi:drug/metabolite transporter (DMT)-like permease